MILKDHLDHFNFQELSDKEFREGHLLPTKMQLIQMVMKTFSLLKYEQTDTIQLHLTT